MIKVLIPSMPTADELLPYLREIDEARFYVKGGPLVKRLERELSALTHSPCTVVGNGTVSLELALRALDLPRGAGVLVPAVTFVATAQAVVNAGYAPVLCDVDAGTWQLSAEHATQIVRSDRSIRAVIPVAAFGLPVPIEPWERFNYRTNLPVLIDAAGAIYGQQTSPVPEIVVSFSLNATKALGAGEGGVVATSDLLLGERVASLANFGPGGTNARMSEYHAAAALASLRHVTSWRADVDRWYGAHLPDGLGLQQGAQPMRTLFPVLLPEHLSAAEEAEWMRRRGIEAKLWYRPFLDERAEFLGCAKCGPMPVTEMLRWRLLGLPYHEFLTEADVAEVCSAFTRITG
jgi:dTDP-4-amino-4,6-dideoxygalactose transaminase